MGHQQQHWHNDLSYHGAWNNQYNYQQQQYYDYSQQQPNPYYPQQQQQQQQQPNPYYSLQQQQQQPAYPYPHYYQHAYPSQPPQQQYSSHAIVHQLHEQTQQRQALGALAAASITSALQKSHNDVSQQTPYTQQQQPQQQQQQQQASRSILNYHDIESTEASAPAQPQSTFCCNRWYRTAAAKAQHEQSHIQCTQCDFVGIKGIVEEHQEVEHGIIPPGGSVRKKSKPDGVVPPNAPKISTPEELAAWIEARKRNWPSQSNMERKQREESERSNRGQLPKTPSSKKRKHKGDTDEANRKTPNLATGTCIDALSAYASNDEEEDDEDDEDDESGGSVVDLEKDAISSKDPSSIGKIALPQVNKPRPGPRCKFFARGRCKHGDKCRYVHEKPSEQHQAKRQHVAQPVAKRPNLLRMLLAKDIREEQNVILQCFRHIVDQEFFGRSNQ